MKHLSYNFAFAELAVQFLETGDAVYLNEIAALDAAAHLFNHASRFNGGAVAVSMPEFVTNLLTPADKYRAALPCIRRNLAYAKEHIANSNVVEEAALAFLPEGFSFSGSMFFTVGYDIGVALGDNCSLNLAHPIFLGEDMHEMVQYAIHELHHTGFIGVKGFMPSLDISTRGEMACAIEYLTHLEGMGTYAARQNGDLLDGMLHEYFEIYRHFKDNPGEALGEADWQKIEILSDVKRLWYVVGAHMAKVIDHQKGRLFLAKLIAEPSGNFIKTFQML